MKNAIELNEMELEQVNGGAGAANYKAYIVVKGDNLTRIAIKFNTTWQKIYNANKAVIGPDPNLIRVGTVLRIPQ